MRAVWEAADDGNDLIGSLDVASDRGVISPQIFDVLRDHLNDGAPYSFDSALVDLNRHGHLRGARGHLALSTPLHKFYCLLWNRVETERALPTDDELRREGCVVTLAMIQD